MRGIENLHPKVREKAELFIAKCKESGLRVAITDTLRTTEEQDALYAKGRTAPGKIVTNAKGTDYSSFHQWGLAFDFCQNYAGMEYNNDDGFFDRAGEIGKSIGLSWGGDFKTPVDKPHFQDNGFGTVRELIAKFGTPERFVMAAL